MIAIIYLLCSRPNPGHVVSLRWCTLLHQLTFAVQSGHLQMCGLTLPSLKFDLHLNICCARMNHVMLHFEVSAGVQSLQKQQGNFQWHSLTLIIGTLPQVRWCSFPRTPCCSQSPTGRPSPLSLRHSPRCSSAALWWRRCRRSRVVCFMDVNNCRNVW